MDSRNWRACRKAVALIARVGNLCVGIRRRKQEGFVFPRSNDGKAVSGGRMSKLVTGLGSLHVKPSSLTRNSQHKTVI